MFCCGFCAGAIVDAWMFHQASPIAVIADESSPSVPVVRIDGIRNSALVGSMNGNLRLIARDHLIVPDASGFFIIHDAKLLTNMIEVHIPPGMKFVASKRGKKYYPVASASAGNLSPANRVYFASEAAARAAGYVR